jgi:regulator of protease activity HflC (stomatin/prohibitin superfamily)
MEFSDQLREWRNKQDKLVIWWTNESEDIVVSSYPSNFGEKSGWPEYLSQAFNRRCGRSTGAKLWVGPPLSSYFTRLDPTMDFSRFMASGGVVMRYGDLHLIHGLPGRITDTDLSPIQIPEFAEPRPLKPVSVAAIPQVKPPPPPEPQYPLLEPEVVEEASVLEEPEAATQSSKESDTMNFEPTPGYKRTFLEKVQANPIKSITAAVLAIIVLCLVFSSIYTINEAERGVVLGGGKLVKIEEPGIHVKFPFYHDVKRISLQTWTDNFPKLSAYSNDQQPADMRVSVTWMANPSEIDSLYRSVLTLDAVTDRFIRPITPTEVENSFGKYTAEKLVQDRNEYVLALTQRIRNMVPPFVTIVSVQVEDINFSDAYELTIEDKAKAEVATATAAKVEAKAIIDARTHVAREQSFATAKQNQMIAEAEGIKAKGDAEAHAIIAKANALKNNPQLIQLIEAENWNGSRATTIYGAVTPTVSVK